MNVEGSELEAIKCCPGVEVFRVGHGTQFVVTQCASFWTQREEREGGGLVARDRDSTT